MLSDHCDHQCTVDCFAATDCVLRNCLQNRQAHCIGQTEPVLRSVCQTESFASLRRNRSQVSDGIVCHAFLKRISALSDHQGASPSHRQTFGLFLFLFPWSAGFVTMMYLVRGMRKFFENEMMPRVAAAWPRRIRL